MSVFTELAKSSKTLLAQAGSDVIERAIEINGILENLMAGLVPLRCRLADYNALTINGQEYLIHKRLAATLDGTTRGKLKDVYLVGVAEKSLFWKDIRQVLFTEARFRVFCRLNRDDMSTSWTSVKLMNILGDFAPNFEQHVNELGPALLAAMTAGAQSQQNVAKPSLPDALSTFGEMIAKEAGSPLDDNRRQEIVDYAESIPTLPTSVAEKRKIFEKVVEITAGVSGQQLDRQVIYNMRIEVSRQYGLALDEQPSSAPLGTMPSFAQRADNKFIDAEVVAIYW